jgi:hypothetical protein
MKAILHAKEEGVDAAGEGWDRPFVTYEVIAFRTGWRGAWDAIKAAWRKDTRMQLPTDFSASLYIKDGKYIWMAQVETNRL